MSSLIYPVDIIAAPSPNGLRASYGFSRGRHLILYDQTLDDPSGPIAHEMCHAAQVERIGYAAFLDTYRRYSYLNNPLEIEARRVFH